MNCICSPTYLQTQPGEHSQRCYDRALDGFEKEMGIILQRRILWETIPSKAECSHPMAHKPHGGCGGQSYDRT